MADEIDFSQYEEKRVTLTVNLPKANEKGELAEEIEGTVVAVNGGVVMLKPKGKTTPTLINVSDIEKIDYSDSKGKPLTVKTLKVVTYGQARNHLLERHGARLSKVNAMDEKQAFEIHKEIDHEGSDLGHVHGDKPKPEDSAADDEG